MLLWSGIPSPVFHCNPSGPYERRQTTIRSQPHSVVRRPIALVAEDEDYLVLNVDREAAKHGASLGRQRGHRVEHELMRDRLSLLDGEGSVIERKGGFIATAFRHGM